MDARRKSGQPSTPSVVPPDKKAATRRARFFSIQRLGEALVLLLALSPVFLIGMVASSKSHWMSWLEKIGVNESWGKERTDVPPAATWKGEGVADFGKFAVQTYDPISGLVRSVHFQLHAVMPYSEQTEFETFIRRTGYAIRDEILVTVRASTLAELSDADLLSRKIAARVNRVFGGETVRSVQISDLSITEFTPESSEN